MGIRNLGESEEEKLIARSGKGKDDEGGGTFTVGGRTYVITKKRWAVMALVCTILFLDIYGVMFFAFVHDVTSAYFRTDPSVTDLVSTINLVARGLSSLVVAMLSDNFNFKSLTMATAAILFSGSILVSVGIASRENFPILIMGQIVGGFAAAIAITLAQMATSNWFPKSEHGKTLGGPLLTRRLSLVASNLVATRSLGNSLYEMKNMWSQNITVPSQTDALMSKVGTTYSMVYLGVAGTAFISFWLCQSFVSDYPPSANNNDKPAEVKRHWNPSAELKATLSVFTSRLFLLIVLHLILFLSVRPLTDSLLSSIVLRGFPSVTDQFAGTLFCVSLTIGGFGATFGGVLLDRLKKPRSTYIGGVLGTCTACALLCVSLYIRSKVLLYFAHILLTFSRDVVLVCINLAMVQSVTGELPSTKVRIFSIAGSLPWISPSAYTFLIRKIMDNFGPSLAVLFPIPFFLLSGFMWTYQCKYFSDAARRKS